MARALRERQLIRYQQQQMMMMRRQVGPGYGRARSGVVIGGYRARRRAGRRPPTRQQIAEWKARYRAGAYGGIARTRRAQVYATLSPEARRIMARAAAGRPLIEPAAPIVAGPSARRPLVRVPTRIRPTGAAMPMNAEEQMERARMIREVRLAEARARIQAHRERWEELVRQAKERKAAS
jgi:hypothetical protein